MSPHAVSALRLLLSSLRYLPRVGVPTAQISYQLIPGSDRLQMESLSSKSPAQEVDSAHADEESSKSPSSKGET